MIDTDRLGLRELGTDDAESLFEILSDAETMKYYPAPYTIEGVNRWIDKSIESYHKNGFGLWAVILKETNSFIGQCGISLQDIDGEIVPEIGYHIHKRYWNRGYVTEAAKAALQYGFHQFGLKKLFIHTYVKNTPSQRIAEKLGMKKIKEYAKHIESHDVVWKHVVFEMSKNESEAK